MGACLGAPETMQQTRQKSGRSKGFNYNVTIERGRAPSTIILIYSVLKPFFAAYVVAPTRKE